MVFEVKIEENHEQNAFKIDGFFACVFLSILSGFGAGLGRVLGGVWRLWGVPWAAFGFIFWCLYLECSPKGLLEPPGFDFGSILDGLGGVWGAFWEGFGRVWSMQNCSFFGTRFLISRSGSWCFWRGLGRKQSALR